jgi:hypothetical protein
MSASAFVVIAVLAWQAPSSPFVSREGGFKIAMPGAPEETKQQVPSAMGPISAHFYQAMKGDLIYFASYSDYPPQAARDEPDQVLEGAVHGAVVEAEGAKLLSKVDRAFGQIRSKEFEFSFPVPSGAQFLGRGRLYLSGSRMYSIMILGPRDQVASASPAYFESFSLTRAAAPFPISAPSTAAAVRTVRVDAAVPAGAMFKPVDFRDHGFRVAFPGKPQERKVSQPSRAGPVDTFVFVVPPQQDGVTYVVTATKYLAPVAPGEVENLLGGFVKNSIVSAKGTGQSQGDIRLGSAPGKEFAFEMKGADGLLAYNRTRAFLANGSFYALTVRGPKDRVTGPTGTSFLNSFALISP